MDTISFDINSGAIHYYQYWMDLFDGHDLVLCPFIYEQQEISMVLITNFGRNDAA